MVSTFRRALVCAAPLLMVLSACGGAVGKGDGGGGGSGGFEFGAAQEEVDAAVADLDPVTLTIQPYAASPDAAAAVAE
ncbi:hypothetical protein [Brevibacterium salitolerans]|uniref:Uncharacterized protein n=3 Tax=Brevibacterium TaxID=1696 RepID=A0ABN2WVB3_9MICO